MRRRRRRSKKKRDDLRDLADDLIRDLQPRVDAAAGYISPEDLQRRDEGGLLEESSLLVFRLWMQLGGPTSPPTPQEIADMEAPLAMDIAWLLRAYKRASESERGAFAMFDQAQRKAPGSEWPHGLDFE